MSPYESIPPTVETKNALARIFCVTEVWLLLQIKLFQDSRVGALVLAFEIFEVRATVCNHSQKAAA